MSRENRPPRKKNLYYDCIEILLRRTNQIGNQRIHRHHVEVKHKGGDPNGLTIPCTFRDHARIHYIRWLVYRDYEDLCAYKGLVGRTDQVQSIISKKLQASYKEKGMLFYSIDFQRTQGSKPKKTYFLRDNPDLALQYAYLGGKAGGMIWTEAKLESSRKKGVILGTNFGQEGGIKHQNPVTKTRLNQVIVWYNEITNCKVRVYGFKTVNSMSEKLNEISKANKFDKGYIKTRQALSEVIRGKETRRFGWEIIHVQELNGLDNSTPTAELL